MFGIGRDIYVRGVLKSASPILKIGRVRWLNYDQRKLMDPRYVFSKPPKKDQLQSDEIKKDSTHIFSEPGKGEIHESEIKTIGEAIAQQRRKRTRLITITVLGTLVATILGYSIGYRVWYCNSQSFIPLYPCSRVRKLSTRDLKRIDVKMVENLSEVRVLEKLSQHEMIKDQYGVPLRDQNGKPPHTHDFSIWCEDQDPCVTGIVFEPDDKRDSTHHWYRIPYLFKWRFTHRPISISGFINDTLNWINLSTSDLYEVISPEKVYGSFKYEYPLQGDNHSLHICFLGEMKLDKETMIIYKGKYHVDVKLERIDLLRTENGELIRYILYKDDNEKRPK
ncbi:Altered inheritance of mitochondria protein 39, mitochondrial [Nakaseomyces bracarensis]|uniref:Altered inheritance of mitochondria protein 39, mitochondrial n=1 Tax=Nakaseomyces bracarensis TaxID=273131 RepID=A0ABR4NPH0_9SACH